MRNVVVAGLSVMLIGAAAPAERVVSGDAIVPVTIKGRALRLRIEPGAPGLPIIAQRHADELGLKGRGMLAVGAAYRVGREQVISRTESVKVGWDGAKPEDRRVGWMTRAYPMPADGAIGPAGVPEPVVRFALRPAVAGEQVATVPMLTATGLAAMLVGSWFVLDGSIDIGGVPVRVRFAPDRPQTLVTAPAAVALAKAYGGVMTAETGRQEIAYGIERPYRIMTLARPFAIGGIGLTRLGVRVTDEDVAGRIAEEGAPAAEPDPDEVVVTAKSKKKPRTGLILLGADALARCSSLTFDKPAKQIRLSCAATPAIAHRAAVPHIGG